MTLGGFSVDGRCSSVVGRRGTGIKLWRVFREDCSGSLGSSVMRRLQRSRFGLRPVATIIGSTVACVVASGCGVGIEGEVARLRSSLSDMRSLQAEQGAQLAQLQADVRGLQGKQEELEFVNTRHFGGEVASLKGEISSLKGRVPPPAGVPARLLEGDEQEARALPSAVGSRLLEGFRLLREGKFLDAVPVFQSSLDAAGDGEGAATSLFWIGVAYDGVRDDRNALFAYNQVVTRFATSPRAPSALLRQAQVFDRLGDGSTAQVTLEKLQKDFPRSPEARVAQARLRRVNGGQR